MLYHEWIPADTRHKIFLPLAEVDDGTQSASVVGQTLEFSKALCNAQKTDTASVVQAYNGAFNYANTWTKFDDGRPFCIYALDIYNISAIGVDVLNAPTCVVGFYEGRTTPRDAATLTPETQDHTQQELMYPLLTSLWPKAKARVGQP